MSSNKKPPVKKTSSKSKPSQQSTILNFLRPSPGQTGFEIHTDLPEETNRTVELKSVQVQTKLVSAKKDDQLLWTIAMDDEAEGLKRTIEVRQKEVESLRAENETLRMHQFELLETNYNLTKDTEEAMEVINEAKEISKILGPLLIEADESPGEV